MFEAGHFGAEVGRLVLGNEEVRVRVRVERLSVCAGASEKGVAMTKGSKREANERRGCYILVLSVDARSGKQVSIDEVMGEIKPHLLRFVCA